MGEFLAFLKISLWLEQVEDISAKYNFQLGQSHSSLFEYRMLLQEIGRPISEHDRQFVTIDDIDWLIMIKL